MINVLLTGAGFTANFGAPLAKEIYEKIFNHKKIQKNKLIRNMLLNEMYLMRSDYEKLFEDILSSEKYDLETKVILKNALLDIFIKDVDVYCRSPLYADNECQPKYLQNFFIKFLNTNDKSIFFSLNQDLFIERRLYHLTSEQNNSNGGHVRTFFEQKGISRNKYVFMKRLGITDHLNTNDMQEYELKFGIMVDDSTYKTALSEFDDWESNKSLNCPYIKLHGSMDWIDANGDPVMITGVDKSNQIVRYKLIEYYNELFAKVLTQMQCKIFIIGYGFNDDHINNALCKSMSNLNMELYVIDKRPLADFLASLAGKLRFNTEYVDDFKKKLRGYLHNGMNVMDMKYIMVDNFLPNY